MVISWQVHRPKYALVRVTASRSVGFVFVFVFALSLTLPVRTALREETRVPGGGGPDNVSPCPEPGFVIGLEPRTTVSMQAVSMNVVLLCQLRVVRSRIWYADPSQ